MRYLPRSAAIAILVAAAWSGPVLDAGAQERAGVSAAVRGRIELAERAGTVGRLIKSGEPVFLGNKITSGPQSGMQLILLDETTFTIGPDSEITIDEFVFDPRSNAGKVTASVGKGVFRFVTGKIAREDPAAMNVKLPVGSIGIRGTIAMGAVDTVVRDGKPQARQLVALVGPGRDKLGKNPRGGIALRANPDVNIDRSGWASELLGTDGQWGDPFPLDPAQLAQLMQLLKQQGGGGLGEENGFVVDNPYLTLAALGSLHNLGQQFSDGNLVVWYGSEPDRQLLVADTGRSFATFEQLRLVNAGVFHYFQGGVALGAGNSYSIFLDINFGARALGGGRSRIAVNQGVLFNAGTFDLPVRPYAGLSGLAAYTFTDVGSIVAVGGAAGVCGGPCTTQVNGQVLNANGAIGGALQHKVAISGDAGPNVTLAAGAGTAARLPGLTP